MKSRFPCPFSCGKESLWLHFKVGAPVRLLQPCGPVRKSILPAAGPIFPLRMGLFFLLMGRPYFPIGTLSGPTDWPSHCDQASGTGAPFAAGVDYGRAHHKSWCSQNLQVRIEFPKKRNSENVTGICWVLDMHSQHTWVPWSPRLWPGTLDFRFSNTLYR
ncbi:hypothetical protein METBIDRAFT_107710 [Metschnikowia bicuspidata var. bicuspidata NRRL YB-4993]|uniref:Uncharacterized protein n=1 Tax=Metschnikowia bicuspidata var. bicuspidata NRRL YB-4993 TaxID=869754 RepID=A0A1A0HHS5_9ASCO|nr:hypothetical protein METBIDRAFT_107710 [Metschnikowia bicuspidata var. bicuspidata NRRL YB-4993]OBA23560.1 hypothetical protein METBIDRAFT_107710 [Metschnikowia bicuspidata var. bicuspidata NRRL YB-4993]